MKTITHILILVLVLIIPNVSATEQEERDNLNNFLEQDNTSEMKKIGYSSGYAYILMKNAEKQNITLDIARYLNYNGKGTHGWSYAFYITENNNYIFIDPFKDELMTYKKASRCLGKNVTSATVKYKYYH